MSTESIWTNVEKMEPLPAGRVVHPRVLDLPETEGRSLVFACYGVVPSARALFHELRPAVEAAWLRELSSAPPPEPIPLVVAMELHCFGPLPGDADDGVRAFGFARLAPEDGGASRHLPLLRAEASRAQQAVPTTATAVFRARVRYTRASTERRHELAQALQGEVFGARPGQLARALLTRFGIPAADANLTSLDAIEERLFTSDADIVRGVSPLLFAPLADLVGVCLAREPELEVGWAEAQADAHGVGEAPLLRVVARGREPVVFPVGLELLRRCVMPRHEAEDIAPLSRWLRDGFTDPPPSS